MPLSHPIAVETSSAICTLLSPRMGSARVPGDADLRQVYDRHVAAMAVDGVSPLARRTRHASCVGTSDGSAGMLSP